MLKIVTLSLFVAVAAADFPLYIDELKDIVRGTDRTLLRSLDKDKSSPRFSTKR